MTRIQRQFSELTNKSDSESPSPVIQRLQSDPGPEGQKNEDQNKDTDRERSLSPAAPRTARGTSPRLQALVKKHSTAIKVANVLMKTSSDAKAKRLHTVKTERKAIKVLGTMFVIFVICWGPFFSLNFAMGVCESCDIEVILFKIFLWLGYTGSTLNPLIYTIFNKTFKDTFIRILKCKHCNIRKIHKSLAFTTSNGTTKVKYESAPGGGGTVTTNMLSATTTNTQGESMV